MKPSVLIIDDEPDVLASLRRLLWPEFEVYTASNGREGLSILARHDIHAILTDQSMTGADGLASVRHSQPDASRILFAGPADLEDVIRAANKGDIYRYIMKPWNPDELLSVVREACERYDLIVAHRTLTEELQQTHAALAETNERLERANRLRDEFLAIFSHDLRTPLSGILGAVELLQTAELQDAVMRDEMVNIIGASGQRMLAMVNNLLDLARIEAGGITLDSRSLAAPVLLTECLHALQPVARMSNVTCRLEAAPGLPQIVGDSAKLYEVFINLINDAIKFAGPNGSVMVSCTRHDANHIQVSVEDTGQGIPPETLPRLFTRSAQVETPGQRHRRSTGLGLYITKQLVELHGGQVGVEGGVGSGSTFWVRLPLKPPGAQPESDAGG